MWLVWCEESVEVVCACMGKAFLGGWLFGVLSALFRSREEEDEDDEDDDEMMLTTNTINLINYFNHFKVVVAIFFIEI